MKTEKSHFVAYFHFIGWRHVSLGISLYLDIGAPNIEIHLPFGFVRLGWKRTFSRTPDVKTFGYDGCPLFHSGQHLGFPMPPQRGYFVAACKADSGDYTER